MPQTVSKLVVVSQGVGRAVSMSKVVEINWLVEDFHVGSLDILR